MKNSTEVNLTAEQRTSLDPRISGWYGEYVVVNNSRMKVFIIDRHNKRHELPAINCHNVEPVVRFYFRQHNGVRYNPDDRSNFEIPINCTCGMLRANELIRNPIYIRELDIVVCLDSFVEDIEHPNLSRSYEEAINKIVSTFNEPIPQIRFFANDPSGIIRKLMVQIGPCRMSLNVTNNPGKNPTLSVFHNTSQNEHTFNMQVFDLCSALNNHGLVTDAGEDQWMFIGEDDASLSRNLEHFQYLESRKMTREQYNEEIKSLETRYAEQVSALKVEQELEIKKQKLTNQQLEHDLKRSTEDNKMLEHQLTEWKAVASARTDLAKDRASQVESENKMKKSNLDYWSTVWKVVGATAIALATWVISRWVKKK